MPEDLKLSLIGSSQLPPPFRALHSPGVRKHCQIIFACYFRKSSIILMPQQNCDAVVDSAAILKLHGNCDPKRLDELTGDEAWIYVHIFN